MDQQDQKLIGSKLLSKGRLVAAGFIVAVLIVVASVLAVRALPGGQTAHAASASGVSPNSGGGGGGCVSSTTPVCTFHGNGADAFFSSSSPDGCVQTNGSLFAAENVTHSPPGPGVSGTTALVFISQFNVCIGTDLLEASGFASGVNFQFSRLDSASLNAAIPATDNLTGNPLTVNVNLTWQGIGGTSTSMDNNHFFSPGFIEITHFVGSSRAAIVTGSISFGTTSFASPNSGGGGGGGGLSGDLTSSKNGTIQIIKQ